MTKIGFIGAESLVKIINWLAIPASAIYAVSMLLVPALTFDWAYIQSVWDRWQSLNVGMLAFLSSVVALNIGKYNADRQAQRNFRAAKAFLPHALNELCEYFEQSARMLKKAWAVDRTEEMDGNTPEPPRGYKSVFQECIRYAKPDVGDFLAQILVWLQVHDARLRGHVEQHADPDYVNPSRLNILTYLVRLGELQAMVNKLFPYARSMEEFDEKPLVWKDYYTAYRQLNIEPPRVSRRLVGLSQAAIAA
jgi:hypothetical protein